MFFILLNALLVGITLGCDADYITCRDKPCLYGGISPYGWCGYNSGYHSCGSCLDCRDNTWYYTEANTPAVTLTVNVDATG